MGKLSSITFKGNSIDINFFPAHISRKGNMQKIIYPKDFVWGTATAAYQIERGLII